MKKRVTHGFCCCRSCKDVFDSEADFLGHLSCDGYCRGGPDRVVREISRIVSSYSRARVCARYIYEN
jgi:hypothetical protein